MSIIAAGGNILGAGGLILSDGAGGGGGGFSAVTNQFIARQGDTTNGVSNGTQNGTTMTLNWTYSGAACDHFVVKASSDYGTQTKIGTVAYAGSGNYSFTYTSFTNAYFPGNIGEPGGTSGITPGGQTTIWDMDAYASDLSETTLGPRSSNLIMTMYGGPNPTAWSSSTAYRVGDLALSGGTQYFCWTAHTNQTPPNSTYWVALTGGNYNSGVGDLSFGGVFTYNAADPVGGGSCLDCNNTSTTGNVCGLQMPSGTPLTQNYGAEVGWANYVNFDMYASVSNQQMDLAWFSRCPEQNGFGGDVTSHINLSNFTNSGLYGGPCVANTWVTFKVPISALAFTTPSSGITTLTGAITSGTLTASSVVGAIDPACWLANAGSNVTTGATSGVWPGATPSQTGNGTYSNIIMGLPTGSGLTGPAPPNVSSSSMTAKRSNSYKTAIKNTTANSWKIRNYYYSRA